MPTRLSTILKINRHILEDNGVFDSTIDFDSHLHIDPALLGKCRIPEFLQASEKVSKYFNDILLLLSRTTGKDALWRAAVKRLSFGEGINTGLGYSQKGTAGNGIGPEIALRICTTAKEIVDAGIIDPAIFDLVPVLESGIGPDRISDMISIILKNDFTSYTKRLCYELDVPRPLDIEGKPFFLVPKELLSDLPVAEQWEDVAVAAAYNESVRQAISSLIGKSWKQIAKEYSKRSLKDLLIKNPDMLRELLAKYKARVSRSYDFEIDHIGILLWDELAKEVTKKFALDLKEYKKVNSENVLEIVNNICKQYKKLVEDNGLVFNFYDDNGDRRPERFPQLLFFGIADSYCIANDLDLSREINAGSGALDFKVSHGYIAKVNVELKYSSNPKLVEGYEKQLPTYNKAEGTEEKNSIYVILRVNDKQDHKIKLIASMIKEREDRGSIAPTFYN